MPIGPVRRMYEHVRGILKHNISLILEYKMEIYLPLLKLETQWIHKNKILNSEIKYWTQRYDTGLRMLNSKYSTHDT